MKRIVLTALIAFPLVAMSQTRTAPAAGENTQKSALTVQDPEVLYVELVITESTAGGTNMRLDPGRDQFAGITDKEVLSQLSGFRAIPITTVPDAMTYLASLGYKYSGDYNVTFKERHETHLLFEKRTGRKPGTSIERPTPPVRKPTGEVPTPAPAPAPAPKK
jgi:hypothetical protein